MDALFPHWIRAMANHREPPSVSLQGMVAVLFLAGLTPVLGASEFIVDQPKLPEAGALYAKLLKDADTALKNGQYRIAASLGGSLLRSNGPGTDGIRQAAQRLMERLEAKAEAIFEEGEKHWWYRDYEQAEPQYRVLFQEFPRSQFFVAARNRLIALRFMPAVASKKLLAAAEAKEANKQFVEAGKRYVEVITQYPETVAAVKAQKALEALERDPAKRQDADAEAHARLMRELDTRWRLAINYLGSKPADQSDWVLYDRGVAYLHEIIALAPDSPQADKARQRFREEQARIAEEEKALVAAREKARAGKEDSARRK